MTAAPTLLAAGCYMTGRTDCSATVLISDGWCAVASSVGDGLLVDGWGRQAPAAKHGRFPGWVA